ncbi:hypothetical protein C2845_PM07G32020 [Panicum miliaceum]|uniref:Uncharacterized protein n=1 Tax=Panicum miliaceum TaxID=4540 RepID=A0A3L6SRU9_PANMI|nr:hypothetical protein C2845_PM07G32020 [Panicum miliaceum]
MPAPRTLRDSIICYSRPVAGAKSVCCFKITNGIGHNSTFNKDEMVPRVSRMIIRDF